MHAQHIARALSPPFLADLTEFFSFFSFFPLGACGRCAEEPCLSAVLTRCQQQQHCPNPPPSSEDAQMLKTQLWQPAPLVNPLFKRDVFVQEQPLPNYRSTAVRSVRMRRPLLTLCNFSANAA